MEENRHGITTHTEMVQELRRTRNGSTGRNKSCIAFDINSDYMRVLGADLAYVKCTYWRLALSDLWI